MKTDLFTYQTASDQETIDLGQRLGRLLEAGDVVALAGELGSGKTWFAKGIARGLGINPSVVITSPSFALVNEYEGKYTFFHMDVYRLESLSELLSAGIEEYLHSGGVVAMEWADRWVEILPEESIWVKLAILDDHRREIAFSGRPGRPRDVIDILKQEVGKG
ncbi:MAG: tRNA (adenosine(37)-N6)-threonylcarbamoyltransferase complex ATPase subunit type 1 TsaE [Deltaproteobacteria bacterium]|nr:tRNA (adenosine(37)-N6)-threonylcarbamoyltransferase complex ATPase subunit type 1 TsaE [Deltaproteobacteria bacterium]